MCRTCFRLGDPFQPSGGALSYISEVNPQMPKVDNQFVNYTDSGGVFSFISSLSLRLCYFVPACQLDQVLVSLRENGRSEKKKLNKTQQTAISLKAWVTAVSRGS